ncbi:hypothetical protein CISG_05322 [Coccidioides immitis RMSCC 3703]|uniref:Hemerythrin-like domain-containing protein n=1 Tax=Coccidioides immitis RMSCC 3703 TaxID=454286 RepID=A0A0J8QT66_COCIT|nr:hypothetical protein CISG_05322 [Coccidioides immitis RMSCC 3703]
MASISDVMRADQQQMRDHYQKIIEAQDDDTRKRWGNQFVWELARYAVAEELVVYPALESHMDHGKVIADKDRGENQQIPSWNNLNKHFDEEQEEGYPFPEICPGAGGIRNHF